jgi:hypothetical protein
MKLKFWEKDRKGKLVPVELERRKNLQVLRVLLNEKKFFIVYGVYNNNPMTWVIKDKTKGQLLADFIEAGVHINLFLEVTEEEFNLCDAKIKSRNSGIVRNAIMTPNKDPKGVFKG